MIWLVDPARPSQKPGYNLLTFVLLLKQRCFDLKKWFGQPSDSVKIQNSNLKPDQIKKKRSIVTTVIIYAWYQLMFVMLYNNELNRTTIFLKLFEAFLDSTSPGLSYSIIEKFLDKHFLL
jgi:hypothetical protein